MLATLLVSPGANAALPPQVPIFRASQDCHELYDRKLYTQSYYACYQAIDDLIKKVTEVADPTPLYLRQADLSTVVALDESALGDHQNAYRWAISAHQIAYYVYDNFTLTPSQFSLVNDIIQRLLDIEARESALIQKKS